MQTVRGLDVPDTLTDVADRSRLALIVYDMQAGIAGRLPNAGPVIDRAAHALDAARSADLRVFYLRHTSLPVEVAGAAQLRSARALQRVTDYADVVAAFPPGSPQHQIIPELEPRPGEAVLDKLTMSAFAGSPLEFALRDAGIHAFAIVGAVLEIGIVPTVLHGLDLGFLPIVIGDGCYSFETDRHSLDHLATTGPIVTADEFTAALSTTATTSPTDH